jgi:hypothetical protein
MTQMTRIVPICVIRAIRGQIPIFLGDDFEELGGVEAEMHRAAGGIEHQDFARILERTVRDVDRLFEEFFLGGNG